MSAVPWLHLPWSALFAATAASLSPRLRWPALLLLGVAGASAWRDGWLDGRAALPLALLLLAAAAVSPRRAHRLRLAGHLLFVVVALGLGFHAFPGFHALHVFGPAPLGPCAVPYGLSLPLDKPLIGLWPLLVLPWLHRRESLRHSLLAAAGALAGAAVVCLGLALAMGFTAWDPHLPGIAAVWMLDNLLLVSLVEEALFRGYVQGGLQRLLGPRPDAAPLALLAAAVLFALAHLGGGWRWALLAGLAGVAYGAAWRHGGLRAAVLAHFGLDALQFFLFVYPALGSCAP